MTDPFDFPNISTEELEADLERTKYFLSILDTNLDEVNEFYGVGNCPKDIMKKALEDDIADLERALNARRS